MLKFLQSSYSFDMAHQITLQVLFGLLSLVALSNFLEKSIKEES